MVAPFNSRPWKRRLSSLYQRTTSTPLTPQGPLPEVRRPHHPHCCRRPTRQPPSGHDRTRRRRVVSDDPSGDLSGAWSASGLRGQGRPVLAARRPRPSGGPRCAVLQPRALQRDQNSRPHAHRIRWCAAQVHQSVLGCPTPIHRGGGERGASRHRSGRLRAVHADLQPCRCRRPIPQHRRNPQPRMSATPIERRAATSRHRGIGRRLMTGGRPAAASSRGQPVPA